MMVRSRRKTKSRPWRFDLIQVVLALALVGLVARLAWLIRCDTGQAAEALGRQHRVTVKLPARPGNIFARARNRYVLLAGSKHAPFCFADPSLVADEQLADVAAKTAATIGMPAPEVLGKLQARRDKRFVVLKEDLTAAEAAAVDELGLRAVKVDYAWRRDYPNATLAAAVLGYRRRDGVAGAGLEQTWDRDILAATEGKRVALADAARRAIWPVPSESIPPRDGHHVFLTIDAGIQGFLAEAVAEAVDRYAAHWGVGVVVEPHSGEILAMCSIPTFNPNHYGDYPQDQIANKALTTPYEPGSVLKPIFSAAAVDAGVASYDTPIFCEHGLYVARRGGRISDHGQSYGDLSLADVVVYSSNIGMAKVGERMGNSALYAAATRFGFGQPTGIELPGESGGIVRPLGAWDGYSTRRVPFGQEISVTSLQLTMAFAAIANGGWLVRPRVVDCVRDAAGRTVWRSERQVVRRVLSEAAAETTREVLTKVVRRGTGKPCRMERWTSFGKTGTAQIAVGGEYVEDAFVGSFVGAAPAGRPEVLCLISVYWPDKSRGHYGSTVAAPFVRRVLQQSLAYLGVPPDAPDYHPPVVRLGGQEADELAWAHDE